jgi:hypothetical protein
MRRAFLPLVALATAFIGIGISGQRVLLYVGIALLLLALCSLLRRDERC